MVTGFTLDISNSCPPGRIWCIWMRWFRKSHRFCNVLRSWGGPTLPKFSLQRYFCTFCYGARELGKYVYIWCNNMKLGSLCFIWHQSLSFYHSMYTSNCVGNREVGRIATPLAAVKRTIRRRTVDETSWFCEESGAYKFQTGMLMTPSHREI